MSGLSVQRRVEVGDLLPNVDKLSVKLDNKNEPNSVEKITTHSLCNKDIDILVFYPGSGTNTCNGHLPRWIAIDGFFKTQCKKQGVCLGIHHVVPDNRDIALMWVSANRGSPRLMLPDWNKEVINSLGLGVDKFEDRHLGRITERACVITVKSELGPLVVDVAVEPNMGDVTERTSPQGVLARLPKVLENAKNVLKVLREKKAAEEKVEKTEQKTPTEKNDHKDTEMRVDEGCACSTAQDSQKGKEVTRVLSQDDIAKLPESYQKLLMATP